MALSTPSRQGRKKSPSTRAATAGSFGADDHFRPQSERILVAASHLFRAYGYEGTSMSAIAKQLGITAPALYRHFTSKDEILFACLESTQRHLLKRTAEAVSDGSPTERLLQFVAVHVRFQIEELDASRMFSSVVYGLHHLLDSLPTERQNRLRVLLREQLETLTSILREGIATREFADTPVTPTAFAIIGMGEHTPNWYRPNGRFTAAEIGELYAQLALKMVNLSRAVSSRTAGDTSEAASAAAAAVGTIKATRSSANSEN